MENDNPFKLVDDTGGTAFDAVNTDRDPKEATPNSVQDFTARMGGLALMENPRNPEEIFLELDRTTAIMRDSISRGEEVARRKQIAAQETLDNIIGLNTLEKEPGLDGNTRAAISQARDSGIALDDATRAKSALEERAIKNIQKYLSVGDETMARVIINNSYGNSVDYMSDFAAKTAVLGRVLEQKRLEGASESFLSAAYGWLLSAIPKNSAFANIGNVEVPDDKAGIFDVLFSGGRKQDEIGAMWTRDKTVEEFAAFATGEFADNITANATTLGFYDPNVAAGLVKDFLPGEYGDTQKAVVNTLDFVDNAFTVSPGTIGRSFVRVTDTLASAGARKAASNNLAEAIRITTTEGAEAAATKTGVTTEELIDNLHTTATRPGETPIKIVPLGSDAISAFEAGMKISETLPDIMKTSRWFNDDELRVAVEAAVTKAEKEAGSEVKDFKVIETRLANGNSVHHVEITFAGQATEEEARMVAGNLGRQGDDVNILTDGNDVWINPDADPSLGSEAALKSFQNTDGNSQANAGWIRKSIVDRKGNYKAVMKDIHDQLKSDGSSPYLVNLSKKVYELLSDEHKVKLNQKLDAAGRYTTYGDKRFTDIGANGATITTMLHEAIHAITLDRIGTYNAAGFDNSFFQTSKKVIGIDVPISPAMDALKAEYMTVFKRFVELVNKDKKAGVFKNTKEAQKSDPGKFNGDFYTKYAASNFNEFLTVTLTEPRVQAYLKSKPHSGNLTMWDKLVRLTQQMLGLKPKDLDMLDEVMSLHDQLFNEMRETPWGPHIDDVTTSGLVPLPQPYRDVSMQYFPQVRVAVTETGFYTQKLEVPERGWLAGKLLGSRKLTDIVLGNKAQVATNTRQRLQKTLEAQFLEGFHKLDKNERAFVGEFLMKQENEGKWFTEQEIRGIWQRAKGESPSEAELGAIRLHRDINDLEYAMRNDELYKDMHIRGMQTVNLNTSLGFHKFNGRVSEITSDAIGKERIYNVTDMKHYAYGLEELTAKEIGRLKSQGYKLVEAEEPIKLSDGTTVKTFISYPDNMTVSELERIQLNYRPGGHRMYTDKYFVKQVARGVQSDTAKAFLLNPSTYITAPTMKEAKAWADTMNKAIDMFKAGATPAELDSEVFKMNKAYPSGADFKQWVDEGVIGLGDKLEAVFDRELPSAYNQAGPDIARFLDEDASGFNGWLRTNGRMYYSSKGEHLKDFRGELAPTLDPYEAISKSLYNIANISSFADYKITAVDRWVRQFKDYLNVKDLPDLVKGSPVRIFNEATVLSNVPEKLKQQIMNQKAVITRTLNWETPFENQMKQNVRSFAEWVDGDGIRSKASQKTLDWFYEKNPVSSLRGFVFDAKLGMFNIGQFAVQTSTSFAAISLSPELGARAIPLTLPMRWYLMKGGDETALDLLAKRGLGKLSGFADEAEFKSFMRNARKSGFFDITSQHQLVNSYGPQAYATFGSKVEKIRELGRIPFNEAEMMNRTFAYRIAWGETVKGGKFTVGSQQFLEQVAGRAEDYAFQMSSSSAAWWQKGVLSVPTQFWAYNARMLEAMLGDTFTPAQRARLAVGQFMLYGTSGIIGMDLVADMISKNNGGQKPSIDSWAGSLNRGFFDTLVYHATGADMSLGARMGTGNWFTDLMKDLTGNSDFADKSTVDVLGGATMGVTFGFAKSLGRLFKYSIAEAGGDITGEDDANYSLTKDAATKMFANISTANNAMKAYVAYRYGMYLSGEKNTLLVDKLPKADAAFIMLGFKPGEADELTLSMQYLSDRSKASKDAAAQIRNWRTEMMVNPDKLEENMHKVNMFVKLLPDDIRLQALKQSKVGIPQSLYDSVEKKIELNQIERDMREQAQKENEGKQ